MRRFGAVWRAAVLAIAVAGCGGDLTGYTPDTTGSAPPMTVEQARQVIRDTVSGNPGRPSVYTARLDHYRMSTELLGGAETASSYPISWVSFISSALVFRTADGATTSIAADDLAPFLDCGFHNCQDPEVLLTKSTSGHDWYGLDLASPSGATAGHPEVARRLADALAVLKRAAQAGTAASSPEDEARFAQMAKAYREAAVKPLPGEDVRRYVVQATAAVKKEDFYGAAEFYDEATRLAPWWPQGHYDRALVLAAIGEYGDAAREMQRYLALVPSAANARQMQDKIYEWQATAPSAAGPISGSVGAPGRARK